MESFVAIVNPAAGHGRCGQRVGPALDRLRAAGVGIDVHHTSSAGEATAIAEREWRSGRRRFMSVGGDGTTYEVLNGLFPRASELRERPTLAILPLGTGNSFLRDFDIVGEEAAISAIQRGKTRLCDVQQVRHRAGVLHYLNILSIGFSARVGSLTNKRFKGAGAAGYGLAVVFGLAGLDHPRYPLRLDDAALDDRACTLLSFSNSQFTGGTMMMAPGADTADGKVDVIRVGPLGRVALLATFPRIYKGTHTSHPKIEHQRSAHVFFADAPATDVMVDGEVMTLTLESIETLPLALEVLA